MRKYFCDACQSEVQFDKLKTTWLTNHKQVEVCTDCFVKISASTGEKFAEIVNESGAKNE